MTKILILQGGFNEEHNVSLNTSREISKAFIKLKINFKTLTVNPNTFEDDILEYSNDYVCFNALHGTFGEDGKIQKILKKNKFKVTHSMIPTKGMTLPFVSYGGSSMLATSILFGFLLSLTNINNEEE